MAVAGTRDMGQSERGCESATARLRIKSPASASAVGGLPGPGR